jgi:GxxExxY protein
MTDLIYKDEAYELTGICMEVHNELGPGLLEIIYKEAIEWELDDLIIQYEREKKYPVYYKKHLSRKKFNADFVVHDKIILEVKSKQSISNEDMLKQLITLNYLVAALD